VLHTDSNILVTAISKYSKWGYKMEKEQLFKISRENGQWLSENYDDLKKTYDKCWIVIQDRKVVKSASTFDEIMQVVRRHDPSKILVEYIQSEPVAMFF
jgi:hypothetical protein